MLGSWVRAPGGSRKRGFRKKFSLFLFKSNPGPQTHDRASLRSSVTELVAESVEAPDIDRVINSIRALFPFGQQHVDKLRDRIEVEAIQSDDIWWKSERDIYVQKR